MAEIETVTSDAVLPVIQEQVLDITGTDHVETGAEAGTTPPGTQDPASNTDVPGKDETPPWLKAEVTKERNRRRASEERAAALEAQVERLTKALEPQSRPEASARPKRDEFFDPDDYDAALIEYAAAEAEKRLETKLSQSRDAQAREAQVTQMQKSWQQQVETASKAHADFADVVYSDDFQCSPAMMQALVAESNGAEVAYHLATNPDEAAKLIGLEPVQQIIAIGKLSAKLDAPKPVSKATPPLKPLGSQAAAVSKAPAEESEAEYFARRTAEARANKERMF